MKVYFTCSTAEFKRYRDSYYHIRNYLVEHGHILTRDWLANANERLERGDQELQDIRSIYRACVTAIREADLVIIEDTVSNFSTGHQITLALRMRKPTLVLWQANKQRAFKQMFIHGIESDFLQVREYTKQDLEAVLTIFINKFSNLPEESRFNLVLDGVERHYLDWVRFSSGKSRTKVIREALRTQLENDKAYQEYLLKQA